MHVLYVHQRFPAQFGHIADRLISRHGFRCTYATEKANRPTGRVQPVFYRRRGSATHATHFASRPFEESARQCHAVMEALQNRADMRPDVIVGHSGFGSTLFLRDLYDCPIINFCEWFYRRGGGDFGLRDDSNQRNRCGPIDSCRNAALLADLDACTLAYSPTNWQRSRMPNEYQYKLETIFDGIAVSASAGGWTISFELALAVLDDPAAYRRQLGQAGLATIHEKYDLDVVLPKMIALYERAIRGEVSRPGGWDQGARGGAEVAQRRRRTDAPKSAG